MNDTAPAPASGIGPAIPEWSQTSEMITLLKLAAARIEYSMKDGDESVNSLTDWFTEMTENTTAILSALPQISDLSCQQSIESSCRAVSDRVQSAIIAFQFYDRMSQRMAHITKILASVSELVADPVKVNNLNQWNELKQQIMQSYTLDSDRALAEQILEGKSVEEALQNVASGTGKKPDNDIELF